MPMKSTRNTEHKCGCLRSTSYAMSAENDPVHPEQHEAKFHTEDSEPQRRTALRLCLEKKDGAEEGGAIGLSTTNFCHSLSKAPTSTNPELCSLSTPL